MPMRLMLKYVMMPIVFPLMGGMVHKLEIGAKRFIDAISDERYKSGVFYASKESGKDYQGTWWTRALFLLI